MRYAAGLTCLLLVCACCCRRESHSGVNGKAAIRAPESTPIVNNRGDSSNWVNEKAEPLEPKLPPIVTRTELPKMEGLCVSAIGTLRMRAKGPPWWLEAEDGSCILIWSDTPESTFHERKVVATGTVVHVNGLDPNEMEEGEPLLQFASGKFYAIGADVEFCLVDD